MTTSDKFINKCNNNLALTHSLTHSPTYSLTCLLAYLLTCDSSLTGSSSPYLVYSSAWYSWHYLLHFAAAAATPSYVGNTAFALVTILTTVTALTVTCLQWLH